MMHSTSWIHQRERTLQDEQEFCFSGYADSLGRFVAIAGWLDHNRLLDRNMLLMIKDVLVTQYCSCISVWKDGQGDARSNLEKLIALYDGGDEILVAAGNDGFRILKMLEAPCSLQWTVIGHQKRPEILLSPVFEAHLRKSRKLIQTYAEEFKIESFFGSFRHWGHPFIDY
jgi:hypothetical protein